MKIIMLKYYNIILLLLCIPFIINISYANKPVVGMLSTKSESYPHELDFSDGIIEMLSSLEAEVLLIDYNELVRQKGDLEGNVRGFITTHGIKRVIIPGNYYNMESEPFAPNTNRQDVTVILTKIANEGTIYLMGICGGLQGIMHAEGVKIVKVQDIPGHHAQYHLVSDPDPHSKNVPLHKVRINPVSRLAEVLKNSNVDMDKNGWIYLYLPDAHSRVLSNSDENIKRLAEAGYKIIGFSNDGMIEIIEDKFGNFHFQDHPEGLVIQRDNDSHSSLRNASTNAMVDMFKDFLNR